MFIPGYDTWRLSGPHDAEDVGTEIGDGCNRIAEPDEDTPRGYRAKPCPGTMIEAFGCIVCDHCGEMA